jgi:hypothetical protein
MGLVVGGRTRRLQTIFNLLSQIIPSHEDARPFGENVIVRNVMALLRRASRYAVALLAIVTLVGCQRSSESEPPPEQRTPPRAPERPAKPFVQMNDPAITDYIVRDIADHLEGGAWRWTFDRPELRFFLEKTDHLRLEVDFTAADATLKDTGPVTVSFFVNGKALGAMKCSKGASYKFTKAVPAHWLKTNEATIVAAEARPLWKAPDGKHLGFILTKMGFVAID